jgi:hypothetical protein
MSVRKKTFGRKVDTKRGQASSAGNSARIQQARTEIEINAQ